MVHNGVEGCPYVRVRDLLLRHARSDPGLALAEQHREHILQEDDDPKAEQQPDRERARDDHQVGEDVDFLLVCEG